MISLGASVPAKRTGQRWGSALSGPTGKSNQFKTPTATDSGVVQSFPNAAHLTKAVAYLGGGSVFPTESPLFLKINHTHSKPHSNSVHRGSEIGMGEIAVP